MATDKHPTFGNGKICYLEIPAIDTNASAAFYHKVFGWHIREREDGSISFDDGVAEVSGTWTPGKKPATDPEIVIHIMVLDMEATLDAVREHGGKIIQAAGMHAPEVTARFSDPAGNVFGLYEHRDQKE